MVTSFTDWNPNELYHFGTKGMKWGQRRFQNPDGSLTALCKARYGSSGYRTSSGVASDLNKLDSEKTTTKYRIETKTNKLNKRIAKAEKSGNAAKVKKLINSKEAKKIAGYKELLEKNSVITNRIIEAAQKSGLTIRSKHVSRMVNKGAVAARLALAVAGTTAAATLLSNAKIAAAPTKVIKTMSRGGMGTNLLSNAGSTFTSARVIRDPAAIARIVDATGRQSALLAPTLGAGAMATAKYRNGTKYKVKNKYKERG